MTEELWPLLQIEFAQATAPAVTVLPSKPSEPEGVTRIRPNPLLRCFMMKFFFLSNSRNIISIVTRVGTQSHSYLYCILHRIASYCIILRSMRQLPKSPPICLLWGWLAPIKSSCLCKHDMKSLHKVWLCRPYNLQWHTHTHHTPNSLACFGFWHSCSSNGNTHIPHEEGQSCKLIVICGQLYIQNQKIISKYVSLPWSHLRRVSTSSGVYTSICSITGLGDHLLTAR